MERANLIRYLATAADELLRDAERMGGDKAKENLQEATELLALGARVLSRDDREHNEADMREAA